MSGAAGERGTSPAESSGAVWSTARRNTAFSAAVFPCERLRNAAEFDSFVPHRNSIADLERARDLGLSACRAEQAQKEAILQELLTRYNDGRRKSLFCTAVCLLELDKLRQAIVRLEERVRPELELRAPGGARSGGAAGGGSNAGCGAEAAQKA